MNELRIAFNSTVHCNNAWHLHCIIVEGTWRCLYCGMYMDMVTTSIKGKWADVR